MTGPDDVYVQVKEWWVSAGPLDHAEGRRFALIVRWSPALGGTWMVTDGAEPPDYVGADGRWSWQSDVDHDVEGWRDAYRFDLDTALAVARAAAPTVTINGGTWAQWQDRWAARKTEENTQP